MNEASTSLRALAHRLAGIYAAQTAPRAILLTGSAATGEANRYSDLDLILYYTAIPNDDALRAAHDAVHARHAFPFGPANAEGYAEVFAVDSVECQLVHTTITAWEAEMAAVREQLDVTSPVQKALAGLLEGVPLVGEAVIAQWQTIAAQYPDALAQAMVTQYLRVFPLWYFAPRFADWDAALWLRRELLDAVTNLLGVLAGLNRLYYSPYQFKHARRFIAGLAIAPTNLASRLESLTTEALEPAVYELAALVEETVALVQAHMPEVATTGIVQTLRKRQQPWRPTDD